MAAIAEFILIVTLLIPIHSHMEKKKGPPNLLIISFDGFRWNYLQQVTEPTPNFNRFLTEGAHSKFGLKNAFITKTFPNHYTLVTGLWEESHGITANTMYDPVLKERFSPANAEEQHSAKWFDNGGEPIWVTNQMQNSHHRSGVCMWVGGGAPVDGTLPTHNILYDESISNKTRIDFIVKWFTEEYPINLGLLYFEQPDSTAHQYGPESPQVKNMVVALDSLVGYLLDKMEEADLLENTNIIITSDHGFSSTPPENIIDLDQFVAPSSYQIFSSNPVANILPNDGMFDQVYKNLSDGAKANGKFKVFKKEDIPDYFHYKNNVRIMPIIVLPDDHYQLAHNKSSPIHELGNHGWNNSLQDMHPFFMAMGPSFKAKATVDVMNNVDVYPLMCHLLGLKPAPNNGSLEHASPLLKTDADNDTNTVATFATYIGILILIALVAGVFMVAACRQHRYLKRKQKQMLPLTSLQSGVRYAMPMNGAKIPLLSSEDEDMIFD